MSTDFEVLGPFEIEPYKGRYGARHIGSDEVKAFWSQNLKFAGRCGCYVFGIKAGRGTTPGYVGKATKTFKQEIFNASNLNKYNKFLTDYKKGRLVIFLVVAPIKRGSNNTRHISDLEDFLIQTAIAVNPELQNIKGTQKADWSIRGVLRSKQGQPPKAASMFRQLMKLNK